MKELSELKNETFEYLTHKYNNQIKGFYEFDGYWQTKDEALKNLNEDRKTYLKELYFYMKSITLEDIKQAIIKDRQEYREKYLQWKDNRSSRYRENQNDISNALNIARTNYNILKRVAFFVGCCVNYFNEEEIKQMIHNTKQDELTSTFYTNPEARLSNAIFRLKILKSYLIDTPFVKWVNQELKDLANKTLSLHEIDIHKLNINNVSLSEVLELKQLVEEENI